MMRRASRVSTAVLAAAFALAGAAHAQPVEAPLDPYADVTPKAQPKKPVKKPATKPVKGKKPTTAPIGPVDPYADATPVAPVVPTTAPPVDPYADPAPVDPYAVPTGTGPTGTGPTKPVKGTKPPTAPVPTPAPVTGAGRIDLAAVQGLLSVQNLDGWLLADLGGMNPVARSLVHATGAPSRRWFYLVPRVGDATLVVHASEVASFTDVPGLRVTYLGYRDLDASLKKLLKGKKTLAMEYSPRGALPSLSRVDAGTIELVRAAGVTVKSSDALVQFAKASWGQDGRKAHYLAAHHLTELRKDAIGFLTDQFRAGNPVTEFDVATRIAAGMAVRGVIGPPPVVAFGAHTADPTYTPSADRSARLVRGDLIVLGLAGKMDGGVYAAITWIAVADTTVSPRVAELFAAATGARDAVIGLIRDRVKRRRALAGWEVDKAATESLVIAGVGDLVLHRTGHSLDVDLYGSGTDLDDLEIHDARSLVVGTGFTIGPGVYVPGELGIRTEVSAFLGKDGIEVTTPGQAALDVLLQD